jgi:hypothetical protein
MDAVDRSWSARESVSAGAPGSVRDQRAVQGLPIAGKLLGCFPSERRSLVYKKVGFSYKGARDDLDIQPWSLLDGKGYWTGGGVGSMTAL